MKKHFSLFITKDEFDQWYADKAKEFMAVCMEIISLTLSGHYNPLFGNGSEIFMQTAVKLENACKILSESCGGSSSAAAKASAIDVLDVLDDAEELKSDISVLLVSSKIRYSETLSSIRGIIQCIADGSLIIKNDAKDPAVVVYILDNIDKDLCGILNAIKSAKDDGDIDEYSEIQLRSYVGMADFYISEMRDINNSEESVDAPKFKEYGSNICNVCSCIRGIFAEVGSVNIPEYRFIERAVANIVKNVSLFEN